MRWPSTEVIVFGLIGVLLMAGRLAEATLSLFRKQDLERAQRSKRLVLLMSLIGLGLLLVTAGYFWFFDPASEAMRSWLVEREAGLGGL